MATLDDAQFEECKRRAANFMMQAAKCLTDALSWAPDDIDEKPFHSVSQFLRQEADALFPSGEKKDGKVIQFVPRRG